MCTEKQGKSAYREKKHRNTERGRDENPCVSRETVESSSEEQTLWGPSGFPTQLNIKKWPKMYPAFQFLDTPIFL